MKFTLTIRADHPQGAWLVSLRRCLGLSSVLQSVMDQQAAQSLSERPRMVCMRRFAAVLPSVEPKLGAGKCA